MDPGQGQTWPIFTNAQVSVTTINQGMIILVLKHRVCAVHQDVVRQHIPSVQDFLNCRKKRTNMPEAWSDKRKDLASSCSSTTNRCSRLKNSCIDIGSCRSVHSLAFIHLMADPVHTGETYACWGCSCLQHASSKGHRRSLRTPTKLCAAGHEQSFFERV